MKIRNGFVSNSSSSSFVVAFPEKPTSAEHVKKMLFGSDETFPNPYAGDMFGNREDTYNTLTIANTVFNDMEEQTSNDVKNIVEGFEGWLEGAPEPDYSNNHKPGSKEWRESWDKYEKESDDYTKKYAANFIKPRTKMFIYTFEYSDNDGDYSCTLEHGGIFDKIDHVRISRH